MEQIVLIGKHTEVPCVEVAATQPLVLLALGQSNAGNHGALPSHAAESVTLIAEGKCIRATDPLPGGTGQGEYLATPVNLALDANRSSRSRAVRSGRRLHLNCRLDKPQ